MSASLLLTFRLLVLSWITAKRQLVHNRTAQRDAWNQSYDFIIVGAGAGGCVVAKRLSEDPSVTVLLLEAGGAQDPLYTDIFWWPDILHYRRPNIFWQYYGEPQANVGGRYPQRRLEEWTGKVIGGSTSHNEMAFNRGNRRGYDNWVKLYGAIGWSYNEVMPYFLKYENNTDLKLVNKYPDYHNRNGEVQISSQKERPRILEKINKAFITLGYQYTDINGPNQTGTTYFQQFADTGSYRVSSGNAFVDPNPSPNNLHIVTRAQVIQILFNGTNAIGLVFNRNDTSFTVYARKEVILSAGAYNTPQLLMLSGVGPQTQLQNFGIPVLMDLPVGDNLMNHPAFSISSRITNSDYQIPSTQLSEQQLSLRYFNNSGPLVNLPQIATNFNTEQNNDINYPNSLIFNGINSDGITLLTAVDIVRVRSRGSLRLQSSSPYVAPRIDPKYLNDTRDSDDLLDGVRFMLYILETPTYGISNLISLPTFESIGCHPCASQYMYLCTSGLRCLIRHNTASAYHPGGSCRMGATSRNDVVVDPELRVKNLSKLRICDASIFPELPNANPTAAVLMVGEKCAQMIKNSHQSY